MSYDDPACLVMNDWNLDNLRSSTQIVTERAYEHIAKYKDSDLVGQPADDAANQEAYQEKEGVSSFSRQSPQARYHR